MSIDRNSGRLQDSPCNVDQCDSAGNADYTLIVDEQIGQRGQTESGDGPVGRVGHGDAETGRESGGRTAFDGSTDGQHRHWTDRRGHRNAYELSLQGQRQVHFSISLYLKMVLTRSRATWT